METRVMASARKFRDLKVTNEVLDEVKAVEETVRQIAAPELVEDAAQVTPMLGRELRALPSSEVELLRRAEPSTEELAERATRPPAPGLATSV